MQYGILHFDEPVPDTSRKILHIDMDAFYASIEVRDNPKLRGKPVVIARHPNLTGGRGIVSTCNYEARKFGIHSAMPAIEAFRLCPQAIFIPGDHAKYRQVSQQIRQIFQRYTDEIQTVALDEAYLDVTVNKLHWPSASLLGRQIQQDIYRELKLTCSVGVSYNKFLAKIASDFQKPAGFTVVRPDQAQAFLLSLPIEKFHGVGQKSLEEFKQLRVKTGQELYQLDLEFLIKHFGKMGLSLYKRVRGQSSNQVISNRPRKSLGKERTFSSFLESEEQVIAQLSNLADRLGQNLQDKGLSAYTVTLKIRYEDFETLTRQISSPQAVENSQNILDNVLDLWRDYGNLDRSIRLLGISLSNFVNPDIYEIELDI